MFKEQPALTQERATYQLNTSIVRPISLSTLQAYSSDFFSGVKSCRLGVLQPPNFNFLLERKNEVME